ncbi:hypothetical protein [Pyxidicoccus trucidator]|uniref:hypothetical protein n=1 Tax=Pyxidicoccus trucidator TaxID=2709662 RepID=UPI0013DA00A8|nr:hypothetical protein [Pyxidicoccus trucidator]
MTRIGDAAAEAARRAAEAMERARKAADEAAKRAAQQARSAPGLRATASTFETRPRAPVALEARPSDAPSPGSGVPRHMLAQWTAPASDAPGTATALLAGLVSMPEAAAATLAGFASMPEAATAPLAGFVSTPEAATASLAGFVSTTGNADSVAATTDPAVCDLTTGDAAEINELAETNPAEAARRMEELIATDPKYQDPAMVDMLLRNCAPALTAIYEVLGKRAENGFDDSGNSPYTRDTLEALAFITSRASPEMQQQIGEGLAFWLPDGDLNQLDDILGELTAAGGPGATLYNVLFGALSATKPAAAQQLEAERIAAATQAFNEAQAGIDELNNELAALIGAAGPGLTQAEYDAIVANFMAEHAQEYARFEAAGADLTALIADNEDVLLHPENYDPDLVAQVQGAANELPELARTQAGFQYLNNEMLASGRGEPSLFDALTEGAEWLETPVEFYDALSTVLVEAAGLAMLTGRPEDAEAALAFLEAKPHVFGLDKKEAQQLRRDLHDIHMGAQRGASRADMARRFETLRTHVEGFGLSSRGADKLLALGAIIGLAGTDFSPESVSEALGTALEFLGGSADVGTFVLGSASRIGGTLGHVSLATGFLTGVMDGVQAYAYARQGEWDHATSSSLLAASGLAPLIGACMGFPGLGTLVGGVLLLGGAGVGLWAQQNDQEQFKEQRLEALLAAGVPEHVARVLVDADPFRMQQLQDAGFTPDQIRVMAERYPGMLTGDTASPTEGMYHAVMSGAFTPDEVMAMLDAASQGGTDPFGADTLLMAFETLPHESGRLDGGPTTREGWMELLNWALENSTHSVIDSDVGRAAIERALAALG